METRKYNDPVFGTWGVLDHKGFDWPEGKPGAPRKRAPASRVPLLFIGGIACWLVMLLYVLLS